MRASSALVIGATLLLSPALLSSATAQMLGYASTSTTPFPSGSIMVEPTQSADEGDAGVVPERLRRVVVAFSTHEAPGTIVIDTPATRLYYVLGGGKAISYGIGVGREGFTWSGVQSVARKQEWPDWHPPAEMIARQPYLPRFMAGGPGNPLGARAMYLGNSLYRIHGTNAPSTIGQRVSSGCIRLTNEDVKDLFERVSVGSKVVVLNGPPRRAPAHVASAPVTRPAPRAIPAEEPMADARQPVANVPAGDYGYRSANPYFGSSGSRIY